jgi:beta-lactamase regulating signal transducer with metallopeptidase domain
VLAVAAAWLVGAYLVGMVLLLGRWLLGYVALGRLLRDAGPAPAPVARLFNEMAGGRRGARLLVCRRLRAPISCGLLRPTVVLPVSLCSPPDLRKLRWVFAHELTHLERRDAWSALLFGLGQAVYFVLPWFWWLRRQVRLCQEFVADAAAAEAAPPADYAAFLLSLTGASAVPLTATGVGGKTSDLFRRVTMLLKERLPVERNCPRRWSLAAGAGLLSLAVVASGIGLSPAAARGDQDIIIRITIPDKPGAEKDVFIKKEVRKVAPVRVQVEKAPEAGKEARQARVIVIEDEGGTVHKKIELPRAGSDKKDVAALTLAKALGKVQEQKHLSLRIHTDMDELRKALEKLNQVMGKEEAEAIRKEITKAVEKLRHLPANFGLALELDALSGNRNMYLRSGPGSGRLGAGVEKPGTALADQLNLPRGKGLVVGDVKAGSAAAKAGLKANDVLLEVNGKAVPSDLPAFARLLDEIKAQTPVDVVVLRKGKQETLQGLTLPESARTTQRLREMRGAEGKVLVVPAPPAPPKPALPMLPGANMKGSIKSADGVLTTTFRTGDRFTTRYQEGSLIINVTGTVVDGKAQASEIHVQDGAASHKYDSVDRVPARYRDKVEHLLRASGGTVRTESKPGR